MYINGVSTIYIYNAYFIPTDKAMAWYLPRSHYPDIRPPEPPLILVKPNAMPSSWINSAGS